MNVINFNGDYWGTRLDDGDPSEDVLRIADALGKLIHEVNPEGNVLIGYDTRPLSAPLAREMGEVIAGHGIKARVSDSYCPAGVLADAVRLDPKATAGVMLTAGNRPGDYFGMRIRMADGSAATSSETDVLEDLIVPELPSTRGEVEMVDLMGPTLSQYASFVGGEAIAKVSPLIVCDPMHGALSSYASRLLGGLGARVIEIHQGEKPDFGGLHPVAAEPWIDDCEQAVIDEGAAFGFALDGAGERLSLIDEKGNLVSSHKMLALVMRYLVSERGLSGRMCSPVFMSSLIRRQAAALGMQLTMTPAGYTWMRDEMLAGDVICAGDALGGIGIPALGLERNALGTAAVLADLIARDGRPLSQISQSLEDELGHMEYGRRDVRMGAGDIQMLRNLLPGINPGSMAGLEPVSVSHSQDSMRAEFEGDAWVLIRPSRNNPMARVYAEAQTKALRDELLDAAANLATNPLAMG